MTSRTKSLFSLACAALLMLLAVGAQATTLNVPGDYPTIQAAINAANAGDTIVVAAGTYPESLSWIGKNLILQGAGAGQSIIDPSAANGGPGGRCLYTSGLTSASRIAGFTFQAGFQGDDYLNDVANGGGMYNYQSSPTVTNCAFSGNVGCYGGGMYSEASSPTVINCAFTGNTAAYGGGMYNYNFASPTVTGCTFSGNQDFDQGGAAMCNDYASDVTVTNCAFTGNSGFYGESFTMVNGGDSATVTGCTFSGNQGDPMSNYSNVMVTGCTFTGNMAWNSGGIISLYFTLTVTDCAFLNNSGGGMYIQGCNATVTGCTFEGNSGGRDGGMFFLGCNATVTNCAFKGNYGNVGAINIEESNSAVTNCTFEGNSGGDGGAILNIEDNLTLTNCAFSGNVASYGGAICNLSTGLTLINCTLSGNWATYGGAIYNGPLFSGLPPSSLTLTNCILWGNTAAAFNGIDNDQGSVSAFTSSDVQDLSNTTPDASGNFGADPLFVDAANANLHLLLGSPCIDAGKDSVVTAPPFLMDPTHTFLIDLDGNPRISRAHVDLGAYEYQNHPPALTVAQSVSVDVGCPVTFPASATDPDGDSVTYSLVNSPAWASINSSTGLVTLAPPAGTAGSFTLKIKATDAYGASDQKSVAVTVCPILISGVTLSRKNGIVTLQFNVSNTDGTIVTNISLNSATLKGVNTMTALPIVYAQLKQGVIKTVQLKFSGVASGPATFLVNGTSSAGPVCANMTVNVP